MTDQKNMPAPQPAKVVPQAPTPLEVPARKPDSGMAIASMILGIISLTGPGLLTGIPAIILGSIALKKSQHDRGLSITGVVTGGISTLISLLLIGFVVWVITSPSFQEELRKDPSTQQEMPFESSRT